MKGKKFLAGLLAGLSVVLGSWGLVACGGTDSSSSSTSSPSESSSVAAQPKGVLYQVIDGEAVVTGYDGEDESVTIEATYEGVAVTKIANDAFNSNETLTEIVIPDSVTVIGASAFTMCLGLTSVTIGAGVTTIDDSAFAYCSNLSSITFNGTKKQWKAIDKTSDWTFVPATKVVCSDGEADLLAK